MTTLLARRIGFHFKEAEMRRRDVAAVVGEAWVPRQLASFQQIWAEASRDIPYIAAWFDRASRPSESKAGRTCSAFRY